MPDNRQRSDRPSLKLAIERDGVSCSWHQHLALDMEPGPTNTLVVRESESPTICRSEFCVARCRPICRRAIVDARHYARKHVASGQCPCVLAVTHARECSVIRSSEETSQIRRGRAPVAINYAPGRRSPYGFGRLPIVSRCRTGADRGARSTTARPRLLQKHADVSPPRLHRPRTSV